MVIDEKDKKYISYGDKFLTAFVSFWIYFGFKANSLQPTLFCSESLFLYTWNGMQIICFLFCFPYLILMFYLKFFKYRDHRNKRIKEFNKMLGRKKRHLKYFLFGVSTVGILELISRFVCGS